MNTATQTHTAYKSALHEMTQTTPTCLWNDSATLSELTASIENGCVGATCNPVIVLEALKREPEIWNHHIRKLAKDMPVATEDQIGWKLVEDICSTRATLLMPAFEQHKGKNGRLSIQTDPRLYRDPKALLEQTLHFNTLGPNMIIKLPVTSAGVDAIEEATYAGISINATACFTLPQCVAVAEAVERGLSRREKEGKEITSMGPVCTIMVGRLDDWLKVIAEKKNIVLDPGYLEWAGVAVFKKTYQLFRQRGYRLRLLSAAFRNHMHWSEFIGGDVVISPPFKWQSRFNSSDIPVISRIDKPVDPIVVKTLLAKFEDFGRAYNEGGIAIAEFDSFGPTARTVRQFLEAVHELQIRVRDIMLPNPDALL